MLLRDQGVDTAESYLSNALKIEEGAYLSSVPSVLRDFGLSKAYIYRDDLTLEELSEALTRATVIASIKRPRDMDAHALLVDALDDGWVWIRDPLPKGSGSAYKVSSATFSQVWLRRKTRYGIALIVE
ncbi:MAG: hypothetical protein M3430_19060 [Acidobacteriota bacterium]|nr:hypothetical protein [Acidobacteriota bacterium]